MAAVGLNPGASVEPVILLHGITSSTALWQVNPASYLLDIGPCYSLSLPAHYPAIALAEFGRPSLTAEEVIQPLDEANHQLVGEQPITLMGHSTGGFSALGLAAHRPEPARRDLLQGDVSPPEPASKATAKRWHPMPLTRQGSGGANPLGSC